MWIALRFCLFLVAVTSAQLFGSYPANEYEYSLRRDYLVQKEQEMRDNNIKLSEDEQIVDHYLQYLKYKHFEATKESGFPPLRPIQDELDTIRSSEIYQALKDLPKGGNMHTHENHDLSRRTLLDIVWDSEDFPNLYILPEDDPTNPYMLDFFINPPEGDWRQVQNDAYYTKEKILENIQLLGIMSNDSKAFPSDSRLRWIDMDKIWSRASSQLINNVKIKSLYLEALYQSALSEGVQYLETRKKFGNEERIYELNDAPEYDDQNGKNYLDENGELDIEMTMEATAAFIAANPDFIGHNRITYSTRFSSKQTVQADLSNAFSLYEKYSSHLKAFDLVGQEDAGHSHLYFLDTLLRLYNIDTSQSYMPLAQHTGETSYPDDLIPSNLANDPVSTAQNAFDALLLGSRRLGHGLAYIKFPFLLSQIKETQTAIESCPVSNQLLGLQADVRSHPAQSYIRMGVPVLLASDDAGSFGVDNITLDWYEAFMAWGLTLQDLKKLANDSLSYSLMSDSEKSEAINTKWEPKWDSYIASKRDEVCAMSLEIESPEFYRVLPAQGAITGNTNIHVFGRHFEWGICKEIRCYFGKIPDWVQGPMAYYVSSNHIICVSPDAQGVNSTQPLTISFNGGASYFDTGLTFTYALPPDSIETTTSTNPSSTVGAAPHHAASHKLALLVLATTLVSWCKQV